MTGNMKNKYNRFKKYYITEDVFLTILKAQDYKCPICENKINAYRKVESLSIDKEYAVIDHCHKCDSIRALTCQSCNTNLGRLENKKLSKLWLEKYEHKLTEYLRLCNCF